MLDAFAKAGEAREACRAAWSDVQRLLAQRQELSAGPEALERELDLLRYQLGEIEAVGLTPEDESELACEHAEAILAIGNAVVEALTESDNCAFTVLAGVQQQLGSMSALLPEAENWREEARSAAVQLQELSRTVGGRLQRVEADPSRLQWLEARMASVQGLKRKYGGSVAAVLARAEEMRARIAQLESREARMADLDARIEAQRTTLAKACAQLGKRRRQAIEHLARRITSELRALGFQHAEFEVACTEVPPGPSGADAVEFGFAPNVGEPMRPLRAIASSGEMSRVMLAVKSVLAAHDRIPVLVFDEIDANIGGEIGNAVGARMKRVAASHQVICITHLPQVAVYGDHHLVVEKAVEGGRTLTRTRPVTGGERAAEIARMLGGGDLTSVSLKHAGEMLRRTAGA